MWTYYVTYICSEGYGYYLFETNYQINYMSDVKSIVRAIRADRPDVTNVVVQNWTNLYGEQRPE